MDVIPNVYQWNLISADNITGEEARVTDIMRTWIRDVSATNNGKLCETSFVEELINLKVNIKIFADEADFIHGGSSINRIVESGAWKTLTRLLTNVWVPNDYNQCGEASGTSNS